MSDLISREAAIDAIEFGITYAKAINKSTGEVMELFREGNKELTKAADRIKALPSAQPERKWIPCKEHLPEVGRNVLLSVGKGLYTAEGELKYDGTWVRYRWSANIENVDAWAEMPEPWKGE